MNLFDTLKLSARDSIHRRSFFELHNGPEDPVQRFYNCMMFGTYVKPHSHAKTETFILLQGAAVMVFYRENGEVDTIIELDDSFKVMDVPANTIHTVFPITKFAIFFIVKQGPYDPNAKKFVEWAPDSWDEYWWTIKDKVLTPTSQSL